MLGLTVCVVSKTAGDPSSVKMMNLLFSSHSVVFGNSSGLAVVDYLQKSLLLNMRTSELYSPSDPYQRQPRSPRKTRQPSGGEESMRSHLNVQMSRLRHVAMFTEIKGSMFTQNVMSKRLQYLPCVFLNVPPPQGKTTYNLNNPT